MFAKPLIHMLPFLSAGSSPVGLLFGVSAIKHHSLSVRACEKYAIAAMQCASIDGRLKAGG